MKYKHIEAAHELRMWIGQIVVPLIGIATVCPDARKFVTASFDKVSKNITDIVKHVTKNKES